jgi:DNA polymerase III subunit epsilon
MNLNTPLSELTLIAFDLETSGKYPLGSEICEMAAVKWKDGEIIETFETLVKPSKKMSDEVIAIHGITNEMVLHQSSIEEKIKSFYDFVKDSVMIAHHSPFDMGFLAWEFEKAGLELPKNPVLCSSLLSRVLIKESPNHRLVTLANTLGVSPGNSHRALDDAKTCLYVGIECFKRLGLDQPLSLAIKTQGQNLMWQDFSIDSLRETDVGRVLVRAVIDEVDVEIVYQGGSRPGRGRPVSPKGIVRGPQRDFLVADDFQGGVEKRYYINRVDSAKFL